MRLSIVTTLYRSANFIQEFHRRAMAAAEQITDDIELVFVNDGSPDTSLDLAVTLHQQDPRVVVVDLSRNFGHHRAMMAGLAEATGDVVFLIDSDLEEDPEHLLPFYHEMQKADCDVVYGVQEKRKGTWMEIASGNLFYWLLRKLGGVNIPRNLTTTRIMSRRYVRELIRHREREIVISALWVLTGFRQIPFSVKRNERKQVTNYGLMVKLRLTIDFVTSFSSNLLYYVFYAGLLISGVSFLAMIYFVTKFATTGQILAGWTSLIASIWMFGGAAMLLLGLIGIYVGRIFEETKQRPYVIIRDIFRAENPQGKSIGAFLEGSGTQSGVARSS